MSFEGIAWPGGKLDKPASLNGRHHFDQFPVIIRHPADQLARNPVATSELPLGRERQIRAFEFSKTAVIAVSRGRRRSGATTCRRVRVG